MVGKKVEGNEEQRRVAARQARREGEAPSARKQTSGASKQRSHLSRHEPHEKKMAAVHQGKQEWQAARDAEADTRGPAAQPEPLFAERDSGEYTAEHEQVFSALTDMQQANGGEAVYLDEVARGSGLDRERTRYLLHDLTVVHRLVTQLQHTDTPDLGPRFEAKPRLLAAAVAVASAGPEISRPGMFDRATSGRWYVAILGRRWTGTDVVSREQVRELRDSRPGYQAAGSTLGIPAATGGQAGPAATRGQVRMVAP